MYMQEKNECTQTANGYMFRHDMEKHGGDTTNEFVIKREKIDKDVMRRVVRESLRIEKAEKDSSVVLMNSKEEHFGTVTVRSSFGIDRGRFEY